MKNSKFVLEKLTSLLEKGIISSKDIGNEIMNILKSKRDEIVFRMKLTSKDEFEILSKRVENLELQLAKSKFSFILGLYIKIFLLKIHPANIPRI